MTLALLCVAGSVSAQEEVHATFANPTGIDWDAENMIFSWSSQYGNQLHNIGLPNGNITEYEYLVVDCEIKEGDGYRFMFYATTKGTTAGGLTIITESGEHKYKLSDFNMDADYLTQCSEICLSGYNASGKVKVNDVYLIKANDPLAGTKKLLMDAITLGKAQNSFAKTEDSFQNLTKAIEDGDTEYANSSATAESLQSAIEAINEAIKGLTLEEGYSNLTQEMFMSHPAQGEDGTSTGCAYDLNVSSGMPYGDGNVFWLNYADLSKYDKLYVTVTAGTPRFCMNRIENNAQDNDDPSTSKFIDIPNHSWGTEAYQTKEGDNIYVINLAKMVEDRGIAYLHSLKGAGGNVTVTGMYLYKSSDPLESYKDALEAAIKQGSKYYPFGKTEESFAALASAISAGESALEAAESQEALESATAAINDAISGLVIEDGYIVVTTDMFKEWDGSNADANEVGVSGAGAINLNKALANGNVLYGYGSGNVYWSHYADLSDYGKIYFVGTPGAQVRLLFNREQGDDEGGSFEQYYIDVNEEGVAEFDLSTVAAGYAHLNTVKVPNGGTFTDILLEAATTVPVTIGSTGYATFCSKKAVALETGMEAYAVEYTGTSAQLIPVEGAVDANTPVILKADAADYELEIVESAATPNKNDLKVSDGNVAGNGSIYVLANGSHDVGFYLLAEGVKIPAGKAYLEVNAGGREFIGFGDATGIKSVETVKANGTVYNLAGQQVKSAQKGVFIVNGKKVIK